MAHILQERYSKLLDLKLRYSIGIVAEFNTRYEGDPKAGVAKIPVRDTEVSVRDYNRQNGLSPDESSTAYLSITIGNNNVTGSYDVAVNEMIDGFEAAAVPDNVIADRIDSAGYSLGVTIENKGLDFIRSVVTSNNVIDGRERLDATTSDEAYNTLLQMTTKASMNKVPQVGRRIAMTPDAFAAILNDNRFLGATEAGFQARTSGIIRTIDGTPIMQSLLLGAVNDPDDALETVEIQILLFHVNWTFLVDEWKVGLRMIDLTTASSDYIGATTIKGRKVGATYATKTDETLVFKLSTIPASRAALLNAQMGTAKAEAQKGAEGEQVKQTPVKVKK